MAISHLLSFRKHPLVTQAITLQRKTFAAVYNNLKYAPSSCYPFYPRNKSKTRAPVEAFQWVSINLRLYVHSQSFPPSQLIIYAWMTEKNMTFSHNRPVFQYGTEPSNYNHNTALWAKTTEEYRLEIARTENQNKNRNWKDEWVHQTVTIKLYGVSWRNKFYTGYWCKM